MGIIKIPVPILKGNKEILRILRQELYAKHYEDIIACTCDRDFFTYLILGYVFNIVLKYSILIIIGGIVHI
ncbi:hypothetical protein A500_10240 [Clostridium sartagoforme AAU1]|uniref:Uncharacterized protein n=1 Tax=Clostridium sartagoforme AAU1 TaxID=1202534 RepID=R9C7P1_9CLOT|nr:hypothetical protein A500_10240 [Clostridium sartagoforme AAU1]